MKYMGSKAAMLKGDLGAALIRATSSAERFWDLFAGSGSVSHFVAERTAVPVNSADVQKYAEPLAACITARTSPYDSAELSSGWLKLAREELEANESYVAISRDTYSSPTCVLQARRTCAQDQSGFITNHYGGYYFSPSQAMALDALHRRLPTVYEARMLALAVLLRVASACAAAPGHTAQPFRPTARLLPHLAQAWERDVWRLCDEQLAHLAARHATSRGTVTVRAAELCVPDVNSKDVVFLDPPYSAAQYSRFYHVLEGIAIGGFSSVAGAGRSPARANRVASRFSMVASARASMESLLFRLRQQGAKVLVTFPESEASNGLSGSWIAETARQMFRVDVRPIASIHSTLGGGVGAASTRAARRKVTELLLTLTPR